MAIPLTTTSLKQGFWPTIMNLSDRFQKRFSQKQLTVLSVSLINGHFRAMSIINDAIHESWERHGVTLKSEALHCAISDAIHYTQFTGTHISILVENKEFMALLI